MTQRIQVTISSAFEKGDYNVSLSTSLLSEAFPSLVCLDKKDVRKLSAITESLHSKIERPDSEVANAGLQWAGYIFLRTIFKPALREQINILLEKADSGQPTRIALGIPHELASIWWEIIYVKQKPLAGFLSANPTLSFGRYTGSRLWDYSAESLLRLRILIVAAQPENLRPVDAEKEIKIVKAALAGKGRIQLDILRDATVETLRAKLSEFKPHILHFIGHAQFDSNGDSGLVLLDEDKKAVLLQSADFARTLRSRSTDAALVILNACETAVVGQSFDNSLAGDLVQAGIPAVIGMQSKIPNIVAIALSQSFYAFLLDGFCQPIDEALNKTRRFLLQQQLCGNLFKKFWCVPALYTRSRDGVLFKLQEFEPTVEKHNKHSKLVERLGHAKESEREIAFEQLTSADTPAAPLLGLALGSDNFFLRVRAMGAFSKINVDLAGLILGFDFSDLSIDSTVPKRPVKGPKLPPIAAPNVDEPFSPPEYSIDGNDIEGLEQKRTEVFNMVKLDIAEMQIAVSLANERHGQLEQLLQRYIATSKQALELLRILYKWSRIANYRKTNVTRGQVEEKVEQVNQLLTNLRELERDVEMELARAIAEYEKSAKKYLVCKKVISMLRAELKMLERRAKISVWKRMQWLSQKQSRINAHERRNTKQFQRFQAKLKNSRQKLTNTKREIKEMIDRITGARIYTSDSYIITISKELRMIPMRYDQNEL